MPLQIIAVRYYIKLDLCISLMFEFFIVFTFMLTTMNVAAE